MVAKLIRERRAVATSLLRMVIYLQVTQGRSLRGHFGVEADAGIAEFSVHPPDQDCEFGKGLDSPAAHYQVPVLTRTHSTLNDCNLHYDYRSRSRSLCSKSPNSLWSGWNQDLINGFQSIFSTHSASRENKSPKSSYVEKKTGKSHPSDLDSDAQSILRQSSTEPKRSDSSFELRTMVPDRRIRITQDIDIASHAK